MLGLYAFNAICMACIVFIQLSSMCSADALNDLKHVDGYNSLYPSLPKDTEVVGSILSTIKDVHNDALLGYTSGFIYTKDNDPETYTVHQFILNNRPTFSIRSVYDDEMKFVTQRFYIFDPHGIEQGLFSIESNYTFNENANANTHKGSLKSFLGKRSRRSVSNEITGDNEADKNEKDHDSDIAQQPLKDAVSTENNGSDEDSKHTVSPPENNHNHRRPTSEPGNKEQHNNHAEPQSSHGENNNTIHLSSDTNDGFLGMLKNIIKLNIFDRLRFDDDFQTYYHNRFFKRHTAENAVGMPNTINYFVDKVVPLMG